MIPHTLFDSDSSTVMSNAYWSYIRALMPANVQQLKDFKATSALWRYTCCFFLIVQNGQKSSQQDFSMLTRELSHC